MKIAVLFVLGATLLPHVSFAAPNAPRAGRSPARSARPAKEVVPLQMQVARVVFPRDRWRKIVRDSSAELTERIVQSAQGQYMLAPEFADRLREEYERLAPYEELVGYQAQVLGHEYSRAELRQLLRFYRSPLGQRSLLLVQDLTQVSNLQMKAKVREGMKSALVRLVPLIQPIVPDDSTATDGEAAAEEESLDLSAADAEAKVL